MCEKCERRDDPRRDWRPTDFLVNWYVWLAVGALLADVVGQLYVKFFRRY